MVYATRFDYFYQMIDKLKRKLITPKLCVGFHQTTLSLQVHPLARSNKQTVCLLLTVYSHPPTSYFIGYSECFPFHRSRFSDCDYIINHICGYVNKKPYDPPTRFNSRRSTFSSIQTGGLVYKKPPAKTALSP